MSVKKMTEVWECDISAPWQQILLAMADIADDDGKSLFPSAEYLAWKMGNSSRQVRRLWADLRQAKILKVLKSSTQHQPTAYQLDLSGLPKKTPWKVLVELKRQSRPDISAGLGNSEEELSTGLEKTRPDNSAGPRPDKIASLDNPDLTFSASDLTSKVSRPDTGVSLSERDPSLRSEEEEGEGEKGEKGEGTPPAPAKKFFKEGGWGEEDRWLYDFLLHQAHLPEAREILLTNSLWWTAMGSRCHWGEKVPTEILKFLDDELSNLAAALAASEVKKPLGRKQWLRRVRTWLIDATDFRELKNARADKRRAAS